MRAQKPSPTGNQNRLSIVHHQIYLPDFLVAEDEKFDCRKNYSNSSDLFTLVDRRCAHVRKGHREDDEVFNQFCVYEVDFFMFILIVF